MLKKIGMRIYYDKNTDEVIFYDNDRMCEVEAPSIDEDFNSLYALQGRSREDTGVIELEYGEIPKNYKEKNCNSWKVQNGKVVYLFDEEVERRRQEIERENSEKARLEKEKKELEEKLAKLEEKNSNIEIVVDEKVNKVKEELSTAMADIIENNEATKVELSTAIADVVDMISTNEG